MLSEKARAGLTQSNHWFKFWMPYLFQALDVPGAKHVYLPLNRNYKPLGYTSREWVKYENYASQAVRFKRDPSSFIDVWRQPKDYDIADRLWLYNDGVESRVDYFERLEKLMGRAMPLHGPMLEDAANGR
jgi:hypothetical protein